MKVGVGNMALDKLFVVKYGKEPNIIEYYYLTDDLEGCQEVASFIHYTLTHVDSFKHRQGEGMDWWQFFETECENRHINVQELRTGLKNIKEYVEPGEIKCI